MDGKGLRIKRIIFSDLLAFMVSLIVFSFYNFLAALVSFFLTLGICFGFLYLKEYFAVAGKIKRTEEVFPDFLQLMSSNLRAGMTIDRAILMSTRPEFYPLDEEILKTGRDITAGKNIEKALLNMAQRIGSPKIEKVVLLINSGIRSGGDLALLLEGAARRTRDRFILEKRATSNVLMYVIFIFLAVSIFAPALFSLSNILVTILTTIFSGLPSIPQAQINLPFSLSKINVSTDFIFYFSLFFIIVIDILASLILGLVNKGEERQGLKLLPIIVIVGLAVFFLTRVIVGNFVGSLF